MALRKERERRYSSPTRLADDIRNYLAGLPLQAAPDSLLYKARKFLYRNRGVVTAMVAIVICLVAGTVVSLAQKREADRQRDEARRSEARANDRERFAKDREQFAKLQQQQAEAARADAVSARKISDEVNQFLTDALAAADPGEGNPREFTVRQMLDRAAEKIEGKFKDQPTVLAPLLFTIGKSYRGLHADREAERFLRAALELQHQIDGGKDASDPVAADMMLDLARVTAGAERETYQARAVEIRSKVYGPQDPRTIGAMNDLSTIRSPDATSTAEQDEKILAGIALIDGKTPEQERHDITAALDIARQAWERGDHNGGVKAVRNYVDRFVNKFQDTLPEFTSGFGTRWGERNDSVAEPLFLASIGLATEAFKPSDLRIGKVHYSYALWLRKQNRYVDAVPEFRSTWEIWEKVYEREDDRLFACATLLADCLCAANNAAAVPPVLATLAPRSKSGMNVIHFAGNWDAAALIAYLVANGVSVEQPDSAGGTPLHSAAARNNVHAATALIRAGAHINSRNAYGGTTPLHLAAANNATDVMELLFRNGVDGGVAADDSLCAVHWAAKYGSVRAVELLDAAVSPQRLCRRTVELLSTGRPLETARTS